MWNTSLWRLNAESFQLQWASPPDRLTRDSAPGPCRGSPWDPVSTDPCPHHWTVNMADTRPCWQLQVPPSRHCWQHWPVPIPVLADSYKYCHHVTADSTDPCRPPSLLTVQVPPSRHCWQHWPVPTPVLAVSYKYRHCHHVTADSTDPCRHPSLLTATSTPTAITSLLTALTRADTRPCCQLQVPPSCHCWQHWPVPTPVLAVSCCSKPNRAPVVTSAVPRRPSDAVAASSSPVRYSAVSVCWSALDTDSSSRQPCCAAARSASAADCRLPYNKRTNHRIFSPTFSVCVLILTVVGRLLAKDS